MPSKYNIQLPVTWNFETLDEMTAFADENKHPASKSSSRTNGDGDWNGANDWPTAMRYARDGWREGTDLVYKMRDEMGLTDISDLIGESEVIMPDVMGGAVDLDRYLEGEPECMLYVDEIVADNPRIMDVYVNAAASWQVSREELERRGAATAVIVDALEGLNIRCEIIMLDMNSWCPQAYLGDPEKTSPERGGSIIRTVVKRAHEPLDLDRIAYALVNAGFLRRHCFAVHETQPDVPGGYGMPWMVTSEEVEGEHVMVPTMMGRRAEWASDEAAIEWIRKCLKPFMEVK